MAVIWNKIWSSIKQFIWIGVIKNFKFFLQAQLTFLGNAWIGWYRFDYGPFQWGYYLDLLLYFPNISGKCCVCRVALVNKWYLVVVKIYIYIVYIMKYWDIFSWNHMFQNTTLTYVWSKSKESFQNPVANQNKGIILSGNAV